MSILLPRLTNFACVEPWWSAEEAVKGVTEEAAVEDVGGWLLFLKLKVTEPAPKLASNSVAILTCGGLPVAFCTTKNSLVTISMTWPVCKTKSPFLLIPSEERHPGTTLGWLRSSRVGLDWNKLQADYWGSPLGPPQYKVTYCSDMKDCNVIMVWAEWQLEDLGRWDAIFDFHRPLVHD